MLLLAALLIAALGLVLTLTGLRSVAPTSRAAGPRLDAGKACAVSPNTTRRLSVAVAGQPRRSALVHLPPRRRAHMPLIVALHGAYGNGAFMERYSGLSRLADRGGFAVVYPDAAGPRWRIAAGEGGADVRFIDALLDRMLSAGCFDVTRVSAVGVSNGAGMAARLACAGDDRLAGLVAVAGDYARLPTCRARRPLSVLEIHGTADAAAPYHPAPQASGGGVLGWVTSWADRDGCSPVPRRTWQVARVLRLDWERCRDGSSVEHLQLVGGAHAWPGADPPDAGPQFGISATDEAWGFLRGRQRSAPLAEDHHR
jgi:polyhydroxybutyrate depolymerase